MNDTNTYVIFWWVNDYVEVYVRDITERVTFCMTMLLISVKDYNDYENIIFLVIVVYLFDSALVTINAGMSTRKLIFTIAVYLHVIHVYRNWSK